MPAEPVKSPSSIDALGEAISHMRQKLFPFSFVGWITLGFVAFLESCGSGSGTSSFRNRGFVGDSELERDIENPVQIIQTVFGWIASHMVWIVAGLMIFMVLSLLFMWIRSRAVFVYIDDVATGRFDLVRPWSEHATIADSFFAVSLVLQGVMFIITVLFFALGAFFVVWANARDWPGVSILMGVVPIAFLFVFCIIVGALLNVALRDFVAPIQLARGVGAQEASAIFVSLLSSNFGLFLGYVLLKIVAWIAVSIVLFIVTCLTCCVAAIPVVGQTLFQPVFYAERAWSLKLLAQLGENVFPKPASPPSSPLPGLDFSPGDAPTQPIDLSEFADDIPSTS